MFTCTYANQLWPSIALSLRCARAGLPTDDGRDPVSAEVALGRPWRSRLGCPPARAASSVRCSSRPPCQPENVRDVWGARRWRPAAVRPGHPCLRRGVSCLSRPAVGRLPAVSAGPLRRRDGRGALGRAAAPDGALRSRSLRRRVTL